jgi:hypothetical protein
MPCLGENDLLFSNIVASFLFRYRGLVCPPNMAVVFTESVSSKSSEPYVRPNRVHHGTLQLIELSTLSQWHSSGTPHLVGGRGRRCRIEEAPLQRCATTGIYRCSSAAPSCEGICSCTSHVSVALACLANVCGASLGINYE